MKVSPAAGIAEPSQAPSIVGGNGQLMIATTMPTTGNSCDADEVAVAVWDNTGTLVNRDFTLLLP